LGGVLRPAASDDSSVTGPLEVIAHVSLPPTTRPVPPGPLPQIEDLLPPSDPHTPLDTRTVRVKWPVADVVELPFSAPAAAGYAAFRARRIASLLIQIDETMGYASQFEVLAEDLEHAFSLPPPGLGAAS